MGTQVQKHFDQLPDEMFSIVQATTAGIGARLGRLVLPGRAVIETPHYLASTSRGVVPHITPDNFVRSTSIQGVYVGLEDFLGARRTPPVAPPAANPNTAGTIAVCTAVGFKALHSDDYIEGVQHVQPDIVLSLADVPYGRALGNRRVERAVDRSTQWLNDHVEARRQASMPQAKLFASLLPVACRNQSYYIESVRDHAAKDVSGLVIHDLSTLENLPMELGPLPRLGFTSPATPQEVLRHIRLGIDVCTIPFTSEATDNGIALSFAFPAPNDVCRDEPLPLGVDMWSIEHAADCSPLTPDCGCYACTDHHRAYIQHLLSAKEMLAWVLLQIHNHHIIESFFRSIRRSLVEGTYNRDVERFQQAYESQLPAKTGEGPRVRGYQYKSEGPGEQRKNRPAYNTLDDRKEAVAGSKSVKLDADSNTLQQQGFAEKQL
ncbi:hypothetical protein LTR78_000065 [Recurvomyces mirabilis]|uniref:Queuine tRNA-ribosyltransferase accessory subunit 2 n=1 Tax=Recurvomyces mirabilis TaxID=574656 RepID=A0AAE0WXC5_9PEZI|nr:hypothetical protein LTR78_000065 [Recurvomyces mirabilis]KAK5161721.1 hypothetical protein LTS14_000066 [Recurvomyces mirabilis]